MICYSSVHFSCIEHIVCISEILSVDSRHKADVWCFYTLAAYALVRLIASSQYLELHSDHSQPEWQSESERIEM